MADVERDLQFGRVLESGSSHKRGLLLILPVVVVFAIIVGFAVVAISRMSGLSTEVKVAQKQAEEAQKAADERDQKLREARSEATILGSAGQGAGVLAATAPDSGASGIAIVHPETNTIGLYAYNLSPPPEGKDYHVISRDASGMERDVARLSPDDRGGAFVLARDVPEGVVHVEVALLPKAGAQQANGAQQPPNGAPQQANGAPQQANGAQESAGQGAAQQPTPQEMVTRQIVLAGDLPRPGEAGVVTAARDEAQAGQEQAKAQGGKAQNGKNQGGQAQARRGRR